MVHSAAIWVYRALELTALMRRENAVGRRGRDLFHIGIEQVRVPSHCIHTPVNPPIQDSLVHSRQEFATKCS